MLKPYTELAFQQITVNSSLYYKRETEHLL